MRGKKSKHAAIDLGLAISGALRKNNEHRTLEEIAAFCGVSKTAIEFIERRALRKMRIRLRQMGVTDVDVREALGLFSPSQTPYHPYVNKGYARHIH